MSAPLRWTRSQRGATVVQVAAGVSIVTSILAAAIPAFVRDFHASRLAEPVAGLGRISQASAGYAMTHAGALPGPAPLTPAQVPRGVLVIEPPTAWEHPTWRALTFEPLPDNAPHAFSFAYDRPGSGFVAHAHGDLDGDGNVSTFEVRGGPEGPEPGLFVLSELE